MGDGVLKARTVMKLGDAAVRERMRRERKRHTNWLWEQKPGRKEQKAARAKAWRERHKEQERERKRRWREENRERYNAYFRNYDALTPGRREYKAKWLRERNAE